MADEDEFPVGVGTRIWRWTREILVVLVLGVLLSILLRTFVAQVFEIPSGSMENTLQVGDRVVVQKITDFHRGDVVVFADPAHWLSDQPQPDERGAFGQVLEFIGLLPDNSTGHLIKRVVGMPGDKVECCDADSRMTVNGVPVDEQEYLYVDPMTHEQVAASEFPFSVTVPEGHLFVMGDHRNASRDSRCYLNDVSLTGPKGSSAFVPVDDVVGKAWFIVFPFDRFTGFSTPSAWDHVPNSLEPPPKQAEINGAEVTC